MTGNAGVSPRTIFGSLPWPAGHCPKTARPDVVDAYGCGGRAEPRRHWWVLAPSSLNRYPVKGLKLGVFVVFAARGPRDVRRQAVHCGRCRLLSLLAQVRRSLVVCRLSVG